jgi:predicted transposase YbfD/YdcC
LGDRSPSREGVLGPHGAWIEERFKRPRGNALAGQTFAAWAQREGRRVWWMREVAAAWVQAGTGERPIERFAQEAAKLRPLNLDGNRDSVPWRPIRAEVRVAIQHGERRIRQAQRQVARSGEPSGRRRRAGPPRPRSRPCGTPLSAYRDVAEGDWRWTATTNTSTLCSPGSSSRPCASASTACARRHREFNLREAEVAYREQRRIDRGSRIAHFPCLRRLVDFDFAAQSALMTSRVLRPPRGPLGRAPGPRCQAQAAVIDELGYLAIAAVIYGADDWVGVATFGRAKETWFRQFLELPNAIPAHDTFGRVFWLLAPGAFEHCFRAWVASIRQVLPGETVAIDGKALRRSHDCAAGLAPLHLVSAWATANRVVLGQVATEAKSNEITAIPRLLELLLLKGCVVTIDAMWCQTKIAEEIIAEGGDYVLALKGNQGTLAAEVEEAFIDADAKDDAGLATEVVETVERGHGRSETRRYRTLGISPGCRAPPCGRASTCSAGSSRGAREFGSHRRSGPPLTEAFRSDIVPPILARLYGY